VKWRIGVVIRIVASLVHHTKQQLRRGEKVSMGRIWRLPWDEIGIDGAEILVHSTGR